MISPDLPRSPSISSDLPLDLLRAPQAELEESQKQCRAAQAETLQLQHELSTVRAAPTMAFRGLDLPLTFR